jgi:hypothetical protein
MFEVGKREKHKVEVWSPYGGEFILRADGKEISRKRVTVQRGTLLSAEVGKKEKHEVTLRFEGFPRRLVCYVDGQLAEAIDIAPLSGPGGNTLLIILLLATFLIPLLLLLIFWR